MFTLGTAVPIFLYLDLLMLMFAYNMTNTNIGQVLHNVTGKTYRKDDSAKMDKKMELSFELQLNIVTDYMMLIMFVYKVYRGINYFLSTIKNPKNDDWLLDPMGELKQESVMLSH